MENSQEAYLVSYLYGQRVKWGYSAFLFVLFLIHEHISLNDRMQKPSLLLCGWENLNYPYFRPWSSRPHIEGRRLFEPITLQDLGTIHDSTYTEEQNETKTVKQELYTYVHARTHERTHAHARAGAYVRAHTYAYASTQIRSHIPAQSCSIARHRLLSSVPLIGCVARSIRQQLHRCWQAYALRGGQWW